MKKVEYIPGSWPLRDLAVKHSLYEAIIIQFFQYFIKIHQRENRNFINGRTWNWISVKNLSEYLGFLSEKQVRCSFDRLIKKEVLITARYNTNKYDKTMWYAFNKEQEYLGENTFESDSKNGRSKRQKRLNEVPDSAKRIAPEGEPIPLNNQFKNTIRSSTDSDILFVKNLFKEYAENSNPHQGSEIGEILKHIEDPRDEFTKEILSDVVLDSFIALRQTKRRDTAYLLGIIRKKKEAKFQEILRQKKNAEILNKHSTNNSNNDPREIDLQFQRLDEFYMNNSNFLSEDQKLEFESKLKKRNERDLFRLNNIMYELINNNRSNDILQGNPSD